MIFLETERLILRNYTMADMPAVHEYFSNEEASRYEDFWPRTAEDVADRLIIIRVSVNMDVFVLGTTPESLWGNAEATTLASEENVEAADIFMVAMKNNFQVGQVIMDRILAGSF